MDRWKAEMGRVREEKRRRKRIKEETVRRKKIQVARKGGKVAKHCVFPMIVAPESRKVGSLKRRVRSQLARWEMKNCTPLWREAHLQVKRYKTPGSRSSFGSWDVEKVHAILARSTFPSQNAKNTTCSDHFFGSWDVEKVQAVVARSTFPSQNAKSTACSDHFWGFRCGVLHGRRKGLRTWSKVSKTWGFCRIS